MEGSNKLHIGLLGEPEGAKRWAAPFGHKRVQVDPDDIAALDALVLAPGTVDPFSRAKEALAAGVPILYAAAFTLSPWQAGVLEALSRRQNTLLRFAELFQYRTGFSFLQRLVRGQQPLWRPLYLRTLCLTQPDAGLRIDELATEELAVCDALLNSRPRYMTAGAVRHDEMGDVCAFFLALHYEDGPVVQCTVSLAEPMDARQIVAVTGDRTVIMDELDPVASLRILGGEGQHDLPAEGAFVTSGDADPVAGEAALFADAVAAGDLSAGNAGRWVRVAALWWSARQSMSFGEPAEVPLPSFANTEPPPLRVIEGGGHTVATPNRPSLTVIAS